MLLPLQYKSSMSPHNLKKQKVLVSFSARKLHFNRSEKYDSEINMLIKGHSAFGFRFSEIVTCLGAYRGLLLVWK